MVASVSTLQQILGDAGLKVNTSFAGAAESGSFSPIGLIFHHDAMGMSYVDSWGGKDVTTVAKNMSVKGANGAQFWVGRSGTWYILCSGRKNHAGKGGPYGNIGSGEGNTKSYGIETDYGPVRSGYSGTVVKSAGYTWPTWDDAHIHSVFQGSAALAKGLNLNTFCGHKEYAPDRKIDPANVDLNSWRAYIKNPTDSGDDDMPLNDADKAFINDAIADGLRKALSLDKNIITNDRASTPNNIAYSFETGLERVIRLTSGTYVGETGKPHTD